MTPIVPFTASPVAAPRGRGWRALAGLWGGGRLFVPWGAGRRWVPGVTPGAAAVLAGGNLLLAVPWFLVLQTTTEWFRRQDLPEHRSLAIMPLLFNVPDPQTAVPNTWGGLLQAVWHDDWNGLTHAGWGEILPQGTMFLLTWLAGIAMLFFMLLPFGARCGSNRACVRHVLKVSLLGTGAIHLVCPALALFLVVSARARWTMDIYDIMTRLIAVFCAVAIYGVLALVRAVGVEYRRPGDWPPQRDPQCEFCGYNLKMAPAQGRCPECGRLVAESLGLEVRRPTPWELAPQWWNPRAVVRLAATMVWNPMALFARMRAYSGKVPVERWLLLALGLVAVAAFGLWPLMIYCTEGRSRLGDPQLYIGSFAMAATWTGLALMMVGIETGGVALVAYFRGAPVDLGAAAKVTSYASILLLFWILVGGAQLLAVAIIWDHNAWWRPIPPRLRPILSLGSFAAAQIGGLLWFEITVYRGLRVVRYANR